MPEVGVTAIGSRDIARAQAYAAALGLARARTYAGLIEDPEVDIAYITLPPPMHADWSIRALEAGKHVLCEKPPAANGAEALQVTAQAARSWRTRRRATGCRCGVAWAEGQPSVRSTRVR